MFQHTAARRRLVLFFRRVAWTAGFNTQPPEGGCNLLRSVHQFPKVSTHSRPKAAAPVHALRRWATGFQHTAARRRLAAATKTFIEFGVSTHSRPKAADYDSIYKCMTQLVSTHSRPKAAGPSSGTCLYTRWCFNTQPPEGGCVQTSKTRRMRDGVSTHSRPKAAVPFYVEENSNAAFQHTAARRRLLISSTVITFPMMFQHTAARRRLINT